MVNAPNYRYLLPLLFLLSMKAMSHEGVHPVLSEVPTVWPEIYKIDWSDLRLLVLTEAELMELEHQKSVLVSLSGRNLQYYMKDAKSNLESYTAHPTEKVEDILRSVQDKIYNFSEKPLIIVSIYSKSEIIRQVGGKIIRGEVEVPDLSPGDIIVFNIRKPWP